MKYRRRVVRTTERNQWLGRDEVVYSTTYTCSDCYVKVKQGVTFTPHKPNCAGKIGRCSLEELMSS